MNIKSTVLGTAMLVVLLTAGAAQSLSGSNTVYTDDIVAGQVYGSDLATNAVSGSKIYPNSVTGADVNEATLSPRTFFVQVTSGGLVKSASPGVTAVKTGGGIYEVTFPRNMTACAAAANPANFPNGTKPVYGPAAYVEMGKGAHVNTQANEVGVILYQYNGSVDADFVLVAACP